MKPYALLVPCFNAEPYLNAFLKNLSLLSLSFDEVIFYDDASTDKTLSMLNSAGCRVIQGKVNKGPGYARNRLAEAASCAYIHFHDIDDEFNPAFLELMGHNLKSAPADVVLGNADWIDAVTRHPVIQWRYDEDAIKQNALIYFLTHPLGIINTLYRKEAFLQVNGFNEDIKCWEDADLHIRLAASGAAFAVVNEIVARSLRHNQGISRDQVSCWNCRLRFLDNYLKQYTAVSNEVFEAELQNAKNALITMGAYQHLGNVIDLKRRYRLHINTGKIQVLYRLSKILPALIIGKGLKILQQLKNLFF